MPFSQDRLDLPLDALIAETKKQQQSSRNSHPPLPRGHNRHFPHNGRGGFTPGPSRRPRNPHVFRTAPYPAQPPMIPGYSDYSRREEYPLGWSPEEEGSTKLYVSNLDYGVTNRDIELLFSEVGELEKHSIHYDKSGRSKGTAEVVYKHQSDALAAIDRYNNHRLDGKTLNIKLVGHGIVATVPVFLPPTTSFLQEQPSNVFQRLGRAESMGSFRGHGRGGIGHERGRKRLRNGGQKVTTESHQWENVSTESQHRRNVTTENQPGKNVTTENQQRKVMEIQL